jgi:hypothetical protein
MQPKFILKIVGWFLVVSSIICLMVSLFVYLHVRNFTRSATRVEGKVIRFKSRMRRDYPVVAFRDTDGIQHELNSSVSSTPPSHQIGDVVTVLYPNNQPQQAKINEFFEMWGLTTFFAGFGLCELIFGLVLLWLSLFKDSDIHIRFKAA